VTFRRGVKRGDLVESFLDFELAGGPLRCRLRLSSRRRTLALRVSVAGEVVVNAPKRLASAEIRQFVRKHLDWITARLEAARAEAFEWRDGAVLPYLGGFLRLQLADAGGLPHRAADALVCSSAPAQAAAQTLRWYRQTARTLLFERLAQHAARAGIAPPPMRLSDARTRWGSLSAKGVVSLNWRLIKASQEEIDYVICHELAHFRQRNHSPAFWLEVAALYPDYLAARARLRRQGRLYFAF
jgi:predicted metal-dependent hydrolase